MIIISPTPFQVQEWSNWYSAVHLGTNIKSSHFTLVFQRLALASWAVHCLWIRLISSLLRLCQSHLLLLLQRMTHQRLAVRRSSSKWWRKNPHHRKNWWTLLPSHCCQSISKIVNYLIGRLPMAGGRWMTQVTGSPKNTLTFVLLLYSIVFKLCYYHYQFSLLSRLSTLNWPFCWSSDSVNRCHQFNSSGDCLLIQLVGGAAIQHTVQYRFDSLTRYVSLWDLEVAQYCNVQRAV